jgi:hypothetical protein
MATALIVDNSREYNKGTRKCPPKAPYAWCKQGKMLYYMNGCGQPPVLGEKELTRSGMDVVA